MLVKKVLLASIITLSLTTANARPLSEIETSGILKVGVPGDYAPLAFYKNDVLVGYDIDVATALAKDWNLKLEFVATSWPTLSEDLEADKFDIAMGGISFTQDRNDRFLLTKPLIPDGKVAMTQCEKAPNLKTVEAINQPSTVVAVNPGGTNERFVNAHLDKATIVRTPNNIENIQMVREKTADMIITDMIEGNYYHHNEPANFCVANDKPFEGTENSQIYMSQKGNVELVEKLNGWLTLNNLASIADQWGIQLNKE